MIRFRAPRWRPEELARRLCQLICGQDNIWLEDSWRWHIGSSNDWWLHPEGDDLYMLHYRYSRTENMQALAVVMTWFLGLEDVTVDGA